MAAEQLARAVKVLHRLLALAAPIGDLGEAGQAVLRDEIRSLSFGPFGADPAAGRVGATVIVEAVAYKAAPH